MGLTVLFQLTFTFIYSTFSKKFSISAKYVDPKQTVTLTGPLEVVIESAVQFENVNHVTRMKPYMVVYM